MPHAARRQDPGLFYDKRKVVIVVFENVGYNSIAVNAWWPSAVALPVAEKKGKSMSALNLYRNRLYTRG